MKRIWLSLTILVGLMIGNTQAWAHDECDDGEEKVAGTTSGEAGGLRSESDTPITIKLFQFQPGRVQVKAGTTVTWINDDEIVHTVTLDAKEKSFDAVLDGKGKSFSFTFTKSGIYTYYCDRHEHMRGEIEVR
jgi:plastocyanin